MRTELNAPKLKRPRRTKEGRGKGKCQRHHIIYRKTDTALKLSRQRPLALLVKVLWGSTQQREEADHGLNYGINFGELATISEF
jgi:hypothetical protein